MKTAEEFLKERDIPNEVITVQRDGFIEGNRVSFLMEEYVKLTRPTVSEEEGDKINYVECDEGETSKIGANEWDDEGRSIRSFFLKRTTISPQQLTDSSLDILFEEHCSLEDARGIKGLMDYDDFKAAIKELLNR